VKTGSDRRTVKSTRLTQKRHAALRRVHGYDNVLAKGKGLAQVSGFSRRVVWFIVVCAAIAMFISTRTSFAADYFHEPTLWDRYPWLIVVIVAMVFAQAALIGVLLHERRRRLYFEVQASRRTAELAHFNRYSTAGELTASIAHELNQPLGAILINVETAELLLESSAPDLDALREIVTDIRRDDQRASNVLQRLRGMLKRAPSEIKDIDLNEIAGESIQLLSPLSIAREVKLSGFAAPMSLPLRGDPVQLQQVIVNLIVNAMDAMSKMPSAQRRVTVDTARDDNFAEVSVSDTGPGIPSEKIKEVFEPFFTTKAQGMGLGLSIARTIVVAHNGRIWAENKAGSGAVFHVSLPLSAT
jgi:signal transduction histidine kinase